MGVSAQGEWPGLMDAALDTCLEVFGQRVRYCPGDDHGVEIGAAIFDDQGLEITATEAGVISSGPWLAVKLADLPGDPDAEGVEIEIGEDRYEVKETLRDGQGGARLKLRKLS